MNLKKDYNEHLAMLQNRNNEITRISPICENRSALEQSTGDKGSSLRLKAGSPNRTAVLQNSSHFKVSENNSMNSIY